MFFLDSWHSECLFILPKPSSDVLSFMKHFLVVLSAPVDVIAPFVFAFVALGTCSKAHVWFTLSWTFLTSSTAPHVTTRQPGLLLSAPAARPQPSFWSQPETFPPPTPPLCCKHFHLQPSPKTGLLPLKASLKADIGTRALGAWLGPPCLVGQDGHLTHYKGPHSHNRHIAHHRSGCLVHQFPANQGS